MWAWFLVAVGCASQVPLPESGEHGEVAGELARASSRVVSGDTRKGVREVDRHACAPSTDESGPEVRYVLELDEPGLVFANLTAVEDGADVDVHLVSHGTCVSRGDNTAVAWLEAGRHEVVVDTWVDRAGRERVGSFDLAIELTEVSEYVDHGLGASVLSRALRAWARGWERGQTRRSELTIVDFARSSEKDRFWTVDLATGELLFSLLTTHGDGSADPEDAGRAATFSNTPGSYQSSLGLMRVAESYHGSFGFSARLDGLEPHNAKVRERFIVIHPHASAGRAVAASQGGAGLSLGCFMLDPDENEAVVTRLRGGTLLWSDFAGAEDMLSSAYLR
jgi:hypothetical protein